MAKNPPSLLCVLAAASIRKGLGLALRPDFVRTDVGDLQLIDDDLASLGAEWRSVNAHLDRQYGARAIQVVVRESATLMVVLVRSNLAELDGESGRELLRAKNTYLAKKVSDNWAALRQLDWLDGHEPSGGNGAAAATQNGPDPNDAASELREEGAAPSVAPDPAGRPRPPSAIPSPPKTIAATLSSFSVDHQVAVVFPLGQKKALSLNAGIESQIEMAAAFAASKGGEFEIEVLEEVDGSMRLLRVCSAKRPLL